MFKSKYFVFIFSQTQRWLSWEIPSHEKKSHEIFAKKSGIPIPKNPIKIPKIKKNCKKATKYKNPEKSVIPKNPENTMIFSSWKFSWTFIGRLFFLVFSPKKLKLIFLTLHFGIFLVKQSEKFQTGNGLGFWVPTRKNPIPGIWVFSGLSLRDFLGKIYGP